MSEAPSFNVVGLDEVLPVTLQHSIYPAINPQSHFDEKSYKDKVVLITGASRGIGQETALYYARAGASVAIVARKQETLDETKKSIESEVPDAQVLAIPVDVKDWKKAEEAVDAVIERFGKLDILIANAGATTLLNKLIGDKNAEEWWNTFEVNVFGVFNFVRPAITHLKKTKGYVVAITSEAAQIRAPYSSDYCISKYTVGRLVEFIALEYPELKVFALHPGRIRTQLASDSGIDPGIPLPDSADLPASTLLYLTAGGADWLTGKYVSANWDLGEVEKSWKEKILAESGLVGKLHIPSAAT